jgi:predicted deacylase
MGPMSDSRASAASTLGGPWSDVDPARHFAADYAQARSKFLAAAAQRDLAVETHVHPDARGPGGTPLAVDVTCVGARDAEQALLITSGTHGIEGFCGSGCQVAMLADDAFVANVERSGVALLLVHALNPFGFAHLSRTTEENVDLNRNFRDFSKLPRNEAYLAIHDFIVPATWPPSAQNEARIGQYMAQHGASALQQAVSGGQCDRAEGLFFGGTRAAWSQSVIRDVLRRLGAPRQRLAWIDIHTGLGPSGHGEKIFAGPDDADMYSRAKAFWGADVTSIWEGTSTSAKVEGMLFYAALEECPGAEYTGIALEFGTQSYMDVINALRARQWLLNQRDADVAQRASILRQIRDAFYVDTDAWKAMVYGQARAASLQALAALKA